MKSLLGLFIFLIALDCSAQWQKETQAIMGTPVTVELWADDPQQGQQCIDKVMQEMRRIDQTMSPYIQESELATINRDSATKPVTVSKELFDLIARSIKLSIQSEGAFDITFASIGYQYDYRKHQRPTDEQIQQQLDRINYRHIVLDDKTHSVRFKKQGVRIDLGGIAKGHAVDNSINILKRCGISQALVSAGGDSRIMGDHQGRPWMTGIKDPRNGSRSIIAIPLENTAISTSGDYERYFIQDGVRYHHIISPKTGKSVKGTRSVTVLGPDATTTDGLSTTIFILGPKKGMELVEKLEDIDVIIIDDHGKTLYSSGLMPPSELKQEANPP